MCFARKRAMPKFRRYSFRAFASVLGWLTAATCCVPTASGQTHEWTEQLGSVSSEGSRGVSADGSGNVYIAGWTSGSLGGSNAGYFDAFVSKYDASGTLQWTRQLGGSRFEKARAYRRMG
jgi:hypothetical protein